MNIQKVSARKTNLQRSLRRYRVREYEYAPHGSVGSFSKSYSLRHQALNKMIRQALIILSSFGCLSCDSKPQARLANQQILSIVVEVVPEGDSSFYIQWKDTLGQSNGYNLRNRPFEVWCFVQDSKDTIGYYKGLSAPGNFAYFVTPDTMVTATFIIGPNIFSKQSIHTTNINELPLTEFNPIKLSLKKGLRQPVEFLIPEKRKILLAHTNP